MFKTFRYFTVIGFDFCKIRIHTRLSLSIAGANKINMSHGEDRLDFWKSVGNNFHGLLGNKNTVLIDLSGTLHIENEETPDAINSLKRLRDAGFQVKFVTNTTKESKRILSQKLKTIGFDLNADEIFTSLSATADYLKRNDLKANLLLIEDLAKEDFIGVRTDDTNPDVVVIGLAPTKFNYENLTKAFNYVLQGAKILAVHKGKYFAKQEGLALGPGPFVAALEHATGQEARVIGKPSGDFFLSALKELNDASPQEAIMIGDDVTDDVLGAIQVGITGVLVKTGKFREGDLNKLPTDASHFVASNFTEAVNHILVATATARGILIENTDFNRLAKCIKLNG